MTTRWELDEDEVAVLLAGVQWLRAGVDNGDVPSCFVDCEGRALLTVGQLDDLYDRLIRATAITVETP